MDIIWYNPDKDLYQRGTIREYDKLISSSDNGDRFDILYEFNRTTIRLADKILNSLNIARKMKFTLSQ